MHAIKILSIDYRVVSKKPAVGVLRELLEVRESLGGSPSRNVLTLFYLFNRSRGRPDKIRVTIVNIRILDEHTYI